LLLTQAEDASTLQLMRKEIGIMRAISYDAHIVQFFGACTTTEPAMLVMEYMRVGHLKTLHADAHYTPTEPS
jgi:serine/threonine protein kinase